MDALGVGLVYSPALEPLLEARGDLVHVLEIEPQVFWLPGRHGEPYHCNERALRHLGALPQPKIAHGVGFPVGGSRPPDPSALALFARDVAHLGARWASEHLSFNRARAGGVEFFTGFLLPPRQTIAGVAAAAAAIRKTAAALQVPFAFETGVNYLRPRPDELTEGAFFAAVAEQADCGIVLDLHNLWANERNGRQPVEDALAEMPLDRVWEVHVAGGFELDGYWLDAHSGAIPEPVLRLAAAVIPRLPRVRALIFEILAPFVAATGLDRIAADLERLHEIWGLARRHGPARAGASRVVARSPDGVTPGEWEDALGGLALGRPPESALARELATDPGIAILEKLGRQGRAGMIVDALRLTTHLFLLAGRAEQLLSILDDFWRSRPPELLAASEADAFAAFLQGRDPALPFLGDVLAFERAANQVQIHGEARTVTLGHEPMTLLEALRDGRLPASVPEGRYEVEVTAPV